MDGGNRRTANKQEVLLVTNAIAEMLMMFAPKIIIIRSTRREQEDCQKECFHCYLAFSFPFSRSLSLFIFLSFNSRRSHTSSLLS